jgi:hypothetical protein
MIYMPLSLGDYIAANKQNIHGCILLFLSPWQLTVNGRQWAAAIYHQRSRAAMNLLSSVQLYFCIPSIVWILHCPKSRVIIWLLAGFMTAIRCEQFCCLKETVNRDYE